MTFISIPYRPAGTEVRSISGLLSDFDAITAVVNGNLDSSNVANASITDAKLASPNNQLYKTTGLDGYFSVPSGVAGGPELFGGFLEYLNPSDFTVAGKTLKQQLAASFSWYTNPGAVTVKLRQCTGLAVDGNPTFSGTVYGQVILSPSGAPGVMSGVSADANFVAAGVYGLTLSWSGTPSNGFLVTSNLNFRNT